ncbi:MAG: hypothetical protein TREMPRED_000929 [Tremellales sp. Tagirdzhanova-0007]|nr:MAG: hypothetical protein TREMPRED_000929 [Tremellales sp. Tagirdzhanova-0007]
MASYDDDHALPAVTSSIPRSNSASSPTPRRASNAASNRETTASNLSVRSFEARLFPQNYEEFIAHVEEAMHEGGLQVDEGLYEDIFGGEDASRRRLQGATESFIDALPHIPSSTASDVDLATCPVCLHFLDAIQTEAEYAEASDGFVPGNAIDLGIRRLPCAHVICGKCARTWLQLVSDSPFVPINNTCPLCRATLDPTVPALAGEEVMEHQADDLLRLFRLMMADRSEGDTPRITPAAEREAFSGMYS